MLGSPESHGGRVGNLPQMFPAETPRTATQGRELPGEGSQEKPELPRLMETKTSPAKNLSEKNPLPEPEKEEEEEKFQVQIVGADVYYRLPIPGDIPDDPRQIKGIDEKEEEMKSDISDLFEKQKEKILSVIEGVRENGARSENG